MFVVLRTVETPKGFFKKRKSKKYFNKIKPETVHTQRGLPFFMLDIPDLPSDKEWNEITEKCGRYASRIVAARNVSLPDYGGLKRFIPSYTPSLLNFNTALETIEKSGADPYEISITVTDRNAHHHSRIHKLLPFASSVRIITSCPEKYVSACKNALDEHGASLILRPSYEPCKKKDIVICCDGGVSPDMNSAAVFIYKQCSTGKLCFCGNGVSLSDTHKSIVPDSIESIDFAGALTELCGSSEYKNSVFSSLISNCNMCDNTSPESCLICFINGRM